METGCRVEVYFTVWGSPEIPPKETHSPTSHHQACRWALEFVTEQEPPMGGEMKEQVTTKKQARE